MKEHKIESTNQQNQLDNIRKEMDHLIKEHRQSSVSLKPFLFNPF